MQYVPLWHASSFWLTSVQNQKPGGADTSGVARPKLGSLPYGGGGIYDCVNAGDIALTFDDGPYLYTSDLLDKLQVRDGAWSSEVTTN